VSAEPAFDWARSGLMVLTGPENGAPLVPGFDAMHGIRSLFDELMCHARAWSAPMSIDATLLTARAHVMRLQRGGTRSCSRTCQLLEARDGWLVLNLPRRSDLDMLQPWLGVDAAADPWPAVARRVRQCDVDDLQAMSAGLGLAVARLGGRVAARGEPAKVVTPGVSPAVAIRCRAPKAPLVIDLSALWAGPLCGQLLAQAGARVIKIESAARPETMRQAWPSLFDRLNSGKDSVVLDFASAGDRHRLRCLLDQADVVISSARPRALHQLGIDPNEILGSRPEIVWIAITAYGWHGAAGDRVGFGDDAAVAGGLVAAARDGRPMFAGDAIADPLTGIAAATAALDALASGRGGLFDISLCATAQRVASAPELEAPEIGVVKRRGREWRLRVGEREVAVAGCFGADRPAHRAARFGADTQRVLDEFT
jgi:hypothetical protein